MLMIYLRDIQLMKLCLWRKSAKKVALNQCNIEKNGKRLKLSAVKDFLSDKKNKKYRNSGAQSPPLVCGGCWRIEREESRLSVVSYFVARSHFHKAPDSSRLNCGKQPTNGHAGLVLCNHWRPSSWAFLLHHVVVVMKDLSRRGPTTKS